MRRLFNPYRLASIVLILNLLGHSFGALINTPDFGGESLQVAANMKAVHFQAQGFDVTFYGFYEGFGWTVSLFFAFSAWLAWTLGGWTPQFRQHLSSVTLPLLLCYVLQLAIAWIYFFPPPIVFTAIVVLLLGIGYLQDRRAAVAGAAA
jgi:hypothetical protein